MSTLDENFKRLEEIIAIMEDILDSKRGQKNLAKLQAYKNKIEAGGQLSMITDDNVRANAAAKTLQTNKRQAEKNNLTRRQHAYENTLTPPKEKKYEQPSLFGDPKNA